MRVVNIVRDASQKRLGIIKSATDTATAHAEKGVRTELWHGGAPLAEPLPHVHEVVVPQPLSGAFKHVRLRRGLDAADTVVVTHGPWGFQTFWGRYLRTHGFVWVYTPHGALEPWSRDQKRLKKSIYFRFLESPMAKRSNAMRALSSSELENLGELFPEQHVELIPNGIHVADPASRQDDAGEDGVRTFLFLGRLHKKKGAARLVEAWNRSSLRDDPQVRLILAGPDEGDYGLFRETLDPRGNVSYVGPAYGPDKQRLLRDSTFYVLPSHSEGLPVSVLEAIESGLIPLITDECNVPEFFVDGGAVRITADVEGVELALEQVRDWSRERIESHRAVLRTILERTYDIRIVGDTLLDFYSGLLRRRSGL